MDMVGHDGEIVQLNRRIVRRELPPAILKGSAIFIHMHLITQHLTE